MGRISPELQRLLDQTGPDARGEVSLIVTLRAGGDWGNHVQAVRAAGLTIAGEEEDIQVLFGEAAVDAVARIAGLQQVELVEPEGGVEALSRHH